VAVGDNLSSDVQTSLDILNAIRGHLPFYTKTMLMNCLKTLDEAEAAIEAGVEALIVGAQLLKPEKAGRLHDMIRNRKNT